MHHFIGLPENVFKYLEPNIEDSGLISEKLISSLEDNIAILEDFKNDYPGGKGIQVIDLGTI